MAFEPEQQAWTNPDEIFMWSTEDKPFSIKWLGTGALSSPTCTLYHNGEDVSATYMTGADNATGRLQTCKSVSGLTGGEIYILHWNVTDVTLVRSAQTQLVCLAAGLVR